MKYARTAEGLIRAVRLILQNIRVSEHDCLTSYHIWCAPDTFAVGPYRDFARRIAGRICADEYRDEHGRTLASIGQLITEPIAQAMEAAWLERIAVRSPFTCEAEGGVCALCYGAPAGAGSVVRVGEPVGDHAAEALAAAIRKVATERPPSWSLGRFCIGYVERLPERAGKAGRVKFEDVRIARDASGRSYVACGSGYLAITDDTGAAIEWHLALTGDRVFVNEGQAIEPGDLLLEPDPEGERIRAEIPGTVRFEGLRKGVDYLERTDRRTGLFERITILSPSHSAIVIQPRDPQLERKVYPLPVGTRLMTDHGSNVEAGDVLAEILGAACDYAGGLAHLIQMLEMRKPRQRAHLAPVSGIVQSIALRKRRVKLRIQHDWGTITREVPIGIGTRLEVSIGAKLSPGDKLIRGEPWVVDILGILGERKALEFWVSELQRTFSWWGIFIDERHLELLLSRMARWCRIEEPGDSNFVEGEVVSLRSLRQHYDRVMEFGGRPASASVVWLGVSEVARRLAPGKELRPR